MKRMVGIAFLLSFILTAPIRAKIADMKQLPSMEILVTASRYASVQPNSTIISQKEIALFNDDTVADVLDTVPGLTIKRYGGKSGSASIFTQGATAEQTLVLLNGFPLRKPIYGTVDFNNLEVDNIERIEVYRGGMSAIYGSDAVGGVINIITKKANTKTHLRLGYASHNDQYISFDHSLNGDSFNLLLSYHSSQHEGFRPVSYINKNSFSSDLNWYLSEDIRLNIFANRYFSQQGNPGSTGPWAATSEQEDQGLNVQENIMVNMGRLGHGKLYFSQREDKRIPIDGNITDSQSWSHRTGYHHRVDWWGHSFVMGGEIQTDRPDDSTLTKNVRIENTAIFINDEMYLSPLWKINIGGRLDQHSKFGQASTYKLSSAWEFMYRTYLKASYGTAFRAPTISDLYYYNAAWGMQGNPDLEPEHSHNVDLEWSSLLSDTTHARISYFQKNIRNLIQWVPPSYATVDNIGNVSLSGFELGYRSQWARNVNYNMNVTYFTNAWDEENNNWLFYRPRYRAACIVNYKSTAGTIDSRLNYVSERKSSTTSSTFDLGAYWTLDVSYTKDWLSLYVKNLFDYQYEESKDYPMEGRTMGVRMKWEW